MFRAASAHHQGNYCMSATPEICHSVWTTVWCADIDTVNSPDDGHTVARNMNRIEINIHEKLCVKLVIYSDHTRMHGQQNKNATLPLCSSCVNHSL
jgi:hypothetical protein